MERAGTAASEITCDREVVVWKKRYCQVCRLKSISSSKRLCLLFDSCSHLIHTKLAATSMSKGASHVKVLGHRSFIYVSVIGLNIGSGFVSI
jgi:hypothetical protein